MTYHRTGRQRAARKQENTMTKINLANYYDADTLRGFTADEYETRKRLYSEREDAKKAAEMEYDRAAIRNPSFDEIIKRWPTLQPLVRKYLDLDNEIKRLDGQPSTEIGIDIGLHPEVREAIERTGETPSEYARKVLVQTLMRDGFLKPPYPRPAAPVSVIE